MALRMATADGMMPAWRRFCCGMGLTLRRAKLSSSHTLSSGSVVICSPSMFAMPSRVMSSSVGPRPPIAMTTSDLRHARSSVSVRRVRSSPTMVTNLSSSPNSGRRWPSQDELVSCVSPMRSSVPTAMISVFMSLPSVSGGTREYSRESTSMDRMGPSFPA